MERSGISVSPSWVIQSFPRAGVWDMSEAKIPNNLTGLIAFFLHFFVCSVFHGFLDIFQKEHEFQLVHGSDYGWMN